MKCLATGSLLFILLCYIGVESVIVEVEQGRLRGEIKTTSTNLGKYYSFKGIPYAAPPIGPHRFKAPQPALKWEGIRNATKHGDSCVQIDSYTNITACGDEDCLFLNVYSPDLSPESALPVMVYIHGGDFLMESGDADRYSPDFLITHGVILVTLNFRLGPFGFLAVGTKEVPGNAGMKDQIAALQWVQKNVNKFGGDPKRVTIFGDGSGAAMVTLHVVSPSAKDLFQRAIAMSGCLLNDWSIEFEPERRAMALGQELGFTTNDPNKLVKFLQSVDPEKLVQARPNILLSDDKSNDIRITTYFTPVVEKEFDDCEDQYLTTCPLKLMCKRQINQVDFMMGHTDNEGLKITAQLTDVLLDYYSKYKELLVPLKIRYTRSPRKVLELADRIDNFYFKNQTISTKVIYNLTRFETYRRYQFDIHTFMERLPKLTNVRKYFYVFRILSSRNYQRGARKFGIRNATHGDVVRYLFDGSSYNLPPVDVNSQEFKYIQLTCDLYTNFAKYGNPTPDGSLGARWPEYEPNKGFMSILSNGTLSPGVVPIYTGADLKFWRELYLSTGVETY